MKDFTRRALLAFLVILSAGACSRRPALSHAETSIEGLALAVLDAVAARDEERLHALALSEQEFRAIVWPELPAARPERNLTADFVWDDLRVKSLASLGATLTRFGGTRLSLVSVQFADETTPYESYLVHRKATLVVKGADGTDETVRLFGSVFEQGGRFKVFSYNID